MTPAGELLELALGVAREAGQELLRRFGGPALGVEHKSSSTDPVSDADRAAEALIRARLHAARPGDAILGEEGGEAAGHGLRWIVDPLDGTVNYLYGLSAWAVSIACEDADGLLAAVVYHPPSGEMFAAARGEGAVLDGRPIAVRPAREPARSLVATGFAYSAEVRERQAVIAARLLPQVRDIRRAGSAALDLAWTAAGRHDAYFERGLALWDRAGGELLVREAGGTIVDLEAADGLPAGLAAGHEGTLRGLLPLLGA